MRIGVDSMGGDFAPDANIHGAILARELLPEHVELVLIGDEDRIRPLLTRDQGKDRRLTVIHAPEVIEMGEHPGKAFAQKKNSSIATGLKLLKSGEIDAFSSAGNTGAMLVGALQIINFVPGVIRPGIAAPFPTLNDSMAIIMDVGINPDCKPDVLYQYGILASLYSRYVYEVADPRVALVNIGSEEEKGNLLTRATFQSMKDSREFNFVGNIEGNDFLSGKVADVLICDGFVGNVVLKLMESVYHVSQKRKVKDHFFDQFNYELYGGMPVLGIQKPVIIGHGISNELAIRQMILHAREVVESKLYNKIKSAFN